MIENWTSEPLLAGSMLKVRCHGQRTNYQKWALAHSSTTATVNWTCAVVIAVSAAGDIVALLAVLATHNVGVHFAVAAQTGCLHNIMQRNAHLPSVSCPAEARGLPELGSVGTGSAAADDRPAGATTIRWRQRRNPRHPCSAAVHGASGAVAPRCGKCFRQCTCGRQQRRRSKQTAGLPPRCLGAIGASHAGVLVGLVDTSFENAYQQAGSMRNVMSPTCCILPELPLQLGGTQTVHIPASTPLQPCKLWG